MMMNETATVYFNPQGEPVDLAGLADMRPMTVIHDPLAIRVSAISHEDSLVVTLEPTDKFERSIRLVLPNEHLTVIANHLLALVRSPAKPSGLKVKATGSAKYFDAFWALYPSGPSDKAPRKIAKRQMLAKWRAENLDSEWDAIHADLNACRIDWAKDGFKYVPLVTTYINQRRWEAREEMQQPEMPLV